MSAVKLILRLAILFIFIFLLPAGSLRSEDIVEITDLRSFTHPSYTRIVIDIGSLREYSPHELHSPDRIYVDLYQARLNPILHDKTTLVGNGYLKSIRIAQRTPSTVRVVADIDFSKVKRYQVFHLFDPFRVVIDIYPQPGVSLKKSNDGVAKNETAPRPTKDGYSMARQLGLGIRRIVIDPGHGGRHPGCIGKNGLQEKRVVLDVCLKLKKLLETQEELEVIMTRESDVDIPLENRTVVANQKEADLFISVHANANKRRSISGVQTFYLNFSTDPEVNETAARENATSTKNIGDMKKIIDKIVTNSKIVESRELAQSVQSNLLRHLSSSYSQVKDMGVRPGPFWVLIGSEMPSVLVEISHLSNPVEEKRLETSRYRQDVAQGIYNGVMKYIRSLGKGQ